MSRSRHRGTPAKGGRRASRASASAASSFPRPGRGTEVEGAEGAERVEGAERAARSVPARETRALGPSSGRAAGRRLRVLITAGPTREHVDPVRYLTNESSGKMGFAIAEAATAEGHEVVLIAGPVNLSTPRRVHRVDVVSARELLDAARREFRNCDALVMAAAVADWRPARKLAAKWRAKDGGAERTTLELVRNPDVLATLTRGRRTPGKTVVAFALETGAGVARARRKLAKKGADWIVLNGPGALGGDRTSVTLLGADGGRVELSNRTKREVAGEIVALLGGAKR